MEEFNVFSYDTPVGKKHADPFRVLSELRRHTNNRIDELMDSAHYLVRIVLPEGDPDRSEHDPKVPEHAQRLQESVESHVELMHATRAAFGFAEFDPHTGNGATDLFLCKTLNDFAAFVSGVKKNTGTSATS